MNRKCLHSAILALMTLVCSWTYADAYYKEIKKNISVNGNATLDIDINFADVNIQTWDKSEMEIVIKLDVIAKDQDRANEMFDAFEVGITEGMDLVSVRVGGGSWSCNSNGKNKESYDIRVEVRMPKKAVLDGKCAFGDVAIGDMAGACQLSVEYGTLKANGLWSYENDVRNSFGDAEIHGTNGGDFHNEYGTLEIGVLQGNAEVRSSFGDLEIEKVKKECKDLEIKVEYADADINLSPDAGFRFEANSSYGEIDLPSEAKKTSSDSDYTSKEVKGTIGNGEGNLDVESDFGDVEIDIIPG